MSLINIINKILKRIVGILCELQQLFFFIYNLAKSPNCILLKYNMDSPVGFMYDINSYK